LNHEAFVTESVTNVTVTKEPGVRTRVRIDARTHRFGTIFFWYVEKTVLKLEYETCSNREAFVTKSLTDVTVTKE